MSGYDCTKPRQRKLSHEQVTEIVQRYNEGEAVKDLAAAFGVTSSAISYRVSKATVLHRDRGAAGIDHGTRRGHQQHRALGLDPCVSCKEANAEYMAAYHARRRAAA